jgi:hypothetical protein
MHYYLSIIFVACFESAEPMVDKPISAPKKVGESAFRKIFKLWIIVVFVLSCGVAYISEPHGMQLKTVHVNNSPGNLPQLAKDAASGSIGWTTQHIYNNYRSSNPLGRLIAKRWDGYVFVAFNYHVVEVTLADLTYASQITITLTSFKHTDQIIS